jgi:hypothetical protein
LSASRSAPKSASIAAPARPRGPHRLRAHLATPLYLNAYFLIIGATTGALLGFLFWTLAARHYATEIVGLNSAVISAMMLVSGACQLGSVLLPGLGIEGVGLAWLASQLVVGLWVGLGIVRPVLLARASDGSPATRVLEGRKG